MLESRWKARLQQVTEEALAYHEAAAAAGRDDGEPRLRELIHRVVAARRELADTEEALARLSAGSYGRCEDCASVIPAELLSVAPETRYCPRCAAGPASGPAAARQ
jgi:RNA polymerase-binding transcription factor DksA